MNEEVIKSIKVILSTSIYRLRKKCDGDVNQVTDELRKIFTLLNTLKILEETKHSSFRGEK